jgi:hypothetical protein
MEKSNDDNPLVWIDAACADLGESLVRRFSCACCRRNWHLIDDDRVWQAIEVAERYAQADATLDELDHAQADVSDALEERATEEWEAEADANFGYTADSCEIAARLYATEAAWYAVSRDMSNPDPDPHLAFPEPRKHSSWYWAAAAVEEIARSEALRWFEQSRCTDDEVYMATVSSAQPHRVAEHREQFRILEQLLGDAGPTGRGPEGEPT